MSLKIVENQYLMSAKELSQRLGVSVSSIYAWRCKKNFPAPIALGSLSRWKWDDVVGWLDVQPRAQPAPPIVSPGRPRATGARRS
jgi:predicted DNA-binding transcriptional regulator AlpA